MTFAPFEKSEITEENAEDLAGPLWSFLGNLSRNGQAYKDELIHDGSIFTAFFSMPELDTLEEMNCNGFVLESFSEIRKKYRITTEILGRNAEAYKLCDCREPSWYILYTLFTCNMSPIICGDCRGMIPTYKFNHVELPKECQPILGWQREYDLITKLWLLSSFDGFTYRQQSNPKSELSKSGRDICATYEKALNKPFYYSLFYWSESGRARGKKCPVCGEAWTLKDDDMLDYKCDKCRLVGL
jgi:predicted  nucleic acid-binding Zn ribbon protein